MTETSSQDAPPPHVARFEGTAAEWDSFVGRQHGATACHLFSWAPLIRGVLGHECALLAARGPTGSLEGVLHLVRVRSMVFGHYLVSMPFLNYGGPLGSDAAVRSLTASAVEQSRREGARLLELRSAVSLPIELPVSHRKITVLRDLPDDPDVLFQTLPAKLRSQVRRPDKEGVTVRFGPDQCDPFYEVFVRHMRDLGTPALPREFFRKARETMGTAMWFGCAWKDGVPVAGGAGFHFGTEFEITWASSLAAYNRIAPNMALYWAFMRQAVEAGVRVFNFGRCSVGSGTHRFKRQWGGMDHPLWWYQSTASGLEDHTPSPTSGAYALGARAWRRLPLPVVRWLGPRIVRLIP